MKKIINTFKYGASDVKRVLIATIFTGLLTVGLFVAAFITSVMVCFFGGIVMFFITVALAQTMGIKEDYHGKTIIPESSMYENVTAENSMPINHVSDEAVPASNMQENVMPASNMAYENMQEPEAPYIMPENYVQYENYEPYENQMPANAMPYAEAASEPVMTQEDKPKKKKKKAKKEKKKKITEKREENIEGAESIGNEGYTETMANTESVGYTDTIENTENANYAESTESAEYAENVESTESIENTENVENTEDAGETGTKKRKKEKKPKKTKQKEDVNEASNDEPQQEENMNEEDEAESFEDDISFDDVEADTGGITEEIVKEYNKKKIKKTLHKYKVKRDHRMVMVDHCDKLNILQTPAYVWTEKNVFSLLLIEKEPRLITFPLFSLNQITYLKKQPANEYAEYAVFRSAGGMLVDLFKPYLPEYTHSTVVNDMTAYKNLYCIGPGIYFTNTSAANLFDLLPAEFVVKDKVTESNKVNVYFKEAYKANIKLRDNVLDAKGYADSISSVLENLAKSTISYNEFKETLNLLIKNKLITQEFAMHYMDVRDKMKR